MTSSRDRSWPFMAVNMGVTARQYALTQAAGSTGDCLGRCCRRSLRFCLLRRLLPMALLLLLLLAVVVSAATCS